jgi:hypothetical protein
MRKAEFCAMIGVTAVIPTKILNVVPTILLSIPSILLIRGLASHGLERQS